jgi:hypothetical protein
MEAPAVSRLLLAIPAAFVLALLLEHVRRNRGARVAVAFALSCGLYGILRGAWVQSISASHGVPMPYRMAGSVRIGAVSPMEIVGWMLAAALAWLVGATLVRFPAHRIAFTGAIVLAALCLAVETAAIAAGWWTWSIPPPPGAFLRVPRIALVDWAFVAFDFLCRSCLPSRARLVDRLLALALFPLHFASHVYLEPPAPALPRRLRSHTLGIPLWVSGARSARERPGHARREWGRYVRTGGAARGRRHGVTSRPVRRARRLALPLVVGRSALRGLREDAPGPERKGLPIASGASVPSRCSRSWSSCGFRRTPALATCSVTDGSRSQRGDPRSGQCSHRRSRSPPTGGPHLIALALYRLSGRRSGARAGGGRRAQVGPAQADEAQRLRRALEGYLRPDSSR